jgi:hypothetical protein
MRQPIKPKPQAFEEVARVLNVYVMLAEEIEKVAAIKTPDGCVGEMPTGDAILAVAERIAARTEG